jgi:hypothetical protein
LRTASPSVRFRSSFLLPDHLAGVSGQGQTSPDPVGLVAARFAGIDVARRDAARSTRRKKERI